MRQRTLVPHRSWRRNDALFFIFRLGLFRSHIGGYLFLGNAVYQHHKEKSHAENGVIPSRPALGRLKHASRAGQIGIYAIQCVPNRKD